MGTSVYCRFDIPDAPRLSRRSGMCRARDLALDRDIELHWWEPGAADFATACLRMDRWGDALPNGTGTAGIEVFDDDRLLYLAVPATESARVLAQLRQANLFIEAPPVPPRSSPPGPVKPPESPGTGKPGSQPVPPAPPPPPPPGFPWWILGLTLLAISALALWWTQRSPAAPVVQVFRGDQSIVRTGQVVHLEWKVANATETSISPGLGRVASEGTTAVYPTVDTIYVLTAKGRSNFVTAEFTVTIDRARRHSGTVIKEPVVIPSPPTAPVRPAITQFFAEPASIEAGQAVTLHWRAQNAEEVRIEPLSALPGRKLNAEDNLTDHPLRTVQYTLTASGAGGTATHTVTVRVLEPLPPSIGYFRASPANIQQCGTAELSWSVDKAARLSIDSLDQAIPSGSMLVHPLHTTSYLLSVQRRTGVPITQTATVSVSLPKRVGPPECGEIVWTGVVGSDGQIAIDGTTGSLTSTPPAREWKGGNMPHAKLKVNAEESYIQVTGQPYLTGRPVIGLSSQRSGLITVHLWWTHVR